MKSFINLSFIVAGLLAAHLSIYAGDPVCRTILTGKEATRVLDQCSRMSPEHDSVAWAPSQADIDTLEHCYPLSLDSVEVPPQQDYCFQYAGFIREGRRYIYINAYPRDFRGIRDMDWSQKAMVICDGGAGFFGMIYDVAGHRFSALDFNGVG